jgi:probable selenium-dependent hydroxylase accessory protein YqeC
VRLTDFFGGFTRQIFSVFGCGGKTSLVWALAASTAGSKTLVTTTTNMQGPEQSGTLFDYFFDEAASRDIHPSKGVAFAGNRKTSGTSISSFTLPALERIIPLFDNVFIEADGSRAKPLKAWADYEPVVTESTTVSVGILPLWPLGKAVSEEIVHRLPLFTVLTGAREGDAIACGHYVPLISGRAADGLDRGGGFGGAAYPLFHAAKGLKILFFNQIEDEAGIEAARRITAMLPRGFRDRLSSVIAGSVRENRVILL